MQTPAYTRDQVLAAAMTLMAKGETPDRLNLWNALGRRGLATTAWSTFLAVREEGLPDLPRQVVEEGISPEVAKATQAHSDTLRTLAEAIRAEAARPLELRVQALEKMLVERTASVTDLEALVDAMEEQMADLEGQLSQIKRGNTPRLII
ncbi:DNA-binding protein [Pseudooceanicola onchidii]|uniref:DNA-binding protein n=1 Tax=Pseudooceanicola onchidii TaxID=2562279 RepID=UPI00145C0920|nr:DNA-binding protein [Pseudooceanicola onchidii]